ncbi:MAG: methyltransferase [Acidobacteria bacterium]|nr:methyltransferase [Acidobacteriota bacterium]
MQHEQYFARTPASRGAERTIELALRGRTATCTTLPGVFSVRGVDKGTAVLLDAVPDPAPDSTCLDLGCGWGPIAMVLASREPSATVWATDVNERACSLASSNARRNGLANVHVVGPDAVPPELRFDMIASNPPARIGRAAMLRMLLDATARLADHGAAWLVVSRHLGADSLAADLAAEGRTVERAGSKRGFRILRVSLTPGAGRGTP